MLIHYIEISNNTEHSRWIPIQADRERDTLEEFKISLLTTYRIACQRHVYMRQINLYRLQIYIGTIVRRDQKMWIK